MLCRSVSSYVWAYFYCSRVGIHIVIQLSILGSSGVLISVSLLAVLKESQFFF
jgi:hypothetical protein